MPGPSLRLSSRPTWLALISPAGVGEVDAAAAPLMLMDDEGDTYSEGPQFAGEEDGLTSSGRLEARVEIFSEKMRVMFVLLRERAGVERLAGGGGAGVADADVSGRLVVRGSGPGQLDPCGSHAATVTAHPEVEPPGQAGRKDQAKAPSSKA